MGKSGDAFLEEREREAAEKAQGIPMYNTAPKDTGVALTQKDFKSIGKSGITHFAQKLLPKNVRCN